MELKNELKTSRDVNVQAVERDLRNLWEQMAETTQAEGQQPVMRVCVLNLMVYTSSEHAVGEVSQIMADVTTQHPSRIFVLLPKYGASESALSAWVTALCHLSAGGHKQVCCEQIMITAADGAVHRLPSLVRSLLVPDLPVVLWWRDIPNFESRLFAELANVSDRVILDSAAFQDPEEGLARLATLIDHRPQWTAFSDLSWSRLTPWRVSVAGFLDVPDWRAHLSRLSRVEIDCTAASDNRRSIPAEALLIVCWLASRLRWHATSKSRRREKDTYQLQLAAENFFIGVEIKSAPSVEGAHGKLQRLRLVADGKPSAQFVVAKSEDGSYLRADVEVDGRKLTTRVLPLGAGDEAQLISKELEILGRDAIFEEAVMFFASLS
jgi:glucose-6-phosphate dehydrogenase assembly protein OpcA